LEPSSLCSGFGIRSILFMKASTLFLSIYVVMFQRYGGSCRCISCG
jgi:hypothetical protein